MKSEKSDSAMTNETVSRLSSAFWSGLIVVLLVAVCLAGIIDHDLWTPDEPREAAIALSMSRSGNYIIPELAGQPFVEKPPLFYIIASLFLNAFGQFIGHTAALRLVAAGCGLGTLFFTYLLGRIYFDRQNALIAAGILATMIGFVHVTHWLLVDNALMFFITASIWALAQAYQCNRLSGLIPAGIFAAGAFLTKGFIGPMIIAMAWAGLFLPQIKKPGWGKILSKKSLVFHGIGLLAALLIACAWIALFYLKGNPELFREWWWTNHFGRFSGQATNLGHISPWHYYFGVLPVYILPWLVPLIAALGILMKKIRRKEPLPSGIALFSFWVIGAFLLLSLSATKREIYLSVLLPACALLSIYGIDLPAPAGAGFPLCQPSHAQRSRLREGGGYGGQAAKAGGRAAEIGKKVYWLWIFLLLASLAAVLVAPLVGNGFFGFAFAFGWQQVAAMAAIAVSILTLSRVTKPFLGRFLIAVAICYATLLIIILPLVDKHKSYSPAFRAAADAIRTRPGLKIAGWNLDETTIAGFYYYCGLTFPAISGQQKLNAILRGQDACFNGVLALTKNAAANDLPDGKNQVIFEGRMGKRRQLQLLAAPDWEK